MAVGGRFRIMLRGCRRSLAVAGAAFLKSPHRGLGTPTVRLDLLGVLAPPWPNFRIIARGPNRKGHHSDFLPESVCSRGAIVLSRLIITWIATAVTIARLTLDGGSAHRPT